MSQQSIYDFEMTDISGKKVSLKDFKGKTALIVNVASQCGLTNQYEALEKIYDQYSSKGFVVLGFPANEFGAQEPGTDQEIQNFCTSNFGVKFPMFSKIVVKGNGIHPLYKMLTSTKPQAFSKSGNDFEKRLEGYGHHREKKSDILWNFEKFLIGKNGEVIERFNPDITPDDQVIVSAIEKSLN